MEPPDSPPQSPPQQWLHDDTLFSATSEGDLDAVKMKLKSGSDPNETDSDGDRRVLHVCTMPWPERMDIARALLEARADVNATRLNGDTALLQCCRDDDAELASVLVAGGADVNQRNHRDRASSGVTGDGGGQTPLVICATLGTTAVLKTLLAAPGVDLGMRYHDSTALELARASGNQEAAQLLLEASPLPTPGAPDQPVSVVISNVLTEEPVGPFELSWGATVTHVLQQYVSATQTSRDQLAMYFEVSPGVREPPGCVSAEDIPGYSKRWPAAIKRPRLKRGTPAETLGGLMVSGQGPLAVWAVVHARPAESSQIKIQLSDEKSGGGCCLVM